MPHQIQNQPWSCPPPAVCRIIWWTTNATEVRDSISSISTSDEALTATPVSFPLWFVSPSQRMLQTTARCAEQGKGQLALLVTSQGSSKSQFLWCSALLQLTPNCEVAFWSTYNSVFWFNFSSNRGLILLGSICLCYWGHISLVAWVVIYNCPPPASPPMMLCSSSLHSKSRGKIMDLLL